MKRLLFACTIALVATLTTIAACKQGEGERCQVNDDCDPPLVCNQAKSTCESTSGGGFDAEVPDAIDGPPTPDAAVDMMPDT